jgi:hypothetical protein
MPPSRVPSVSIGVSASAGLAPTAPVVHAALTPGRRRGGVTAVVVVRSGAQVFVPLETAARAAPAEASMAGGICSADRARYRVTDTSMPGAWSAAHSGAVRRVTVLEARLVLRGQRPIVTRTAEPTRPAPTASSRSTTRRPATTRYGQRRRQLGRRHLPRSGRSPPAWQIAPRRRKAVVSVPVPVKATARSSMAPPSREPR